MSSKILAFAGSARKDSFNKQLVRLAAAKIEAHGGEVTLIDLADYPQPIYDGDLEGEQGIPENARHLYQLMNDHAGLLLACPEYNSSITPLLKNTIDWLSRPREGDKPLQAFQGKVAGLLAASPGKLGGLRGLVHVRSILGNIGVVVVPQQAAIPVAHEKLDEAGQLQDESLDKAVDGVCRSLVEMTQRLHG